MTHVFRTKENPQANGRQPIVGEFQYTLTFPLEDGSILKVLFGKEGMRNLRNVVLSELCDDETADGN